MGKKWISIILIVGVMFVGFSVRIYGVTNKNLTVEEVTSPNTTKNKQSIAGKVLADTGRTDQFSPEEAQRITIYRGNVSGDSANEIVLAIEFTPKNTIVAVYTPDGNTYKYIGDVGEFFEVTNIEFIPIENLGRDVLTIREYADQNIGAYEKSRFIKGYLYKDGIFSWVLNIPEEVNANWNEAWDIKNTTEVPSLWNRITEQTDATFKDGGEPTIMLVHTQKHLISDDTKARNIPEDSTFKTVGERIVAQTYRWNIEWELFILSEKIDNATGEKVAVVEDFGTWPYALLKDYGENSNKVRIVRKNGVSQVVDKSTLSDVPGNPPSTETFISN